MIDPFFNSRARFVDYVYFFTLYNFLGFNSSNNNAVSMSFYHVVCMRQNHFGPQNFLRAQKIELKKGSIVWYLPLIGSDPLIHG